VLERGHEQAVSSPADGWFAEIVRMPGESPWPIALALSLSLVFVALLLSHYVIASVFLGLCLLTLLGWHSREPEEA
jgi:uncharacterized membrane protein YccC